MKRKMSSEDFPNWLPSIMFLMLLFLIFVPDEWVNRVIGFILLFHLTLINLLFWFFLNSTYEDDEK